MEIVNYGSICIEGGDQLGKGDATSRIVKELKADGVNLTFSSFPIYATPVGSVIRSLLKEGISDKKLEGIDTLDVRMALFALNRLEFMDVYLSDSTYSNTILIFDRSPFSNAVSIGYWLSLQKNWDKKEVKGYIDRAMDLETLMISKLGLKRCVVQLKSEEREWKDIRRKDTDQHEKREVQEKSDMVYEMYKDMVGSGWHQVVTKSDDGWRDRDDIWKDIKEILKETYGDLGDIKQGVRYDIGFKEIVENMYSGAMYDNGLYDTYDSAIKKNVKEVMYESGLKLSSQVAGSCRSIKFSNREVKREFKRMVDIVPDVMRVYEHFLGKDFVGKLEKALV